MQLPHAICRLLLAAVETVSVESFHENHLFIVHGQGTLASGIAVH